MCDDQDIVPRDGPQLVEASRTYMERSRLESWWHLGSTLVLMVAALAMAASFASWPARVAGSMLGGLLIVRAFILFHDFMHNSLLHDSRVAKLILHLFGLVMLTPPRHWRFSHNFHHAHVGQILGTSSGSFPVVTSDMGSFPLMTTVMWRNATVWQRLRYRTSRHPGTILLAGVTIFLFTSCLVPLLRNPRKYWDGALSLAAHGGVMALLWAWDGWPAVFWGFLLPFYIASALGAYLFYAQHTFELMSVVPSDGRAYVRGALESSSCMLLGPVMNWFTGNIGYHHVHHLNARIPFYRLPEAMAGIRELQHPRVTSLRVRDVVACFHLNLWDPTRQRLVSYREAEMPPGTTPPTRAKEEPANKLA
jgi:acyl-lipid omega-6 desaturase (Delta-12 desaturase)